MSIEASILLAGGWHPIFAEPYIPDGPHRTDKFYPRPEEVLVVQIGPNWKAGSPLTPADVEARDLLEGAFRIHGPVTIRTKAGQAEFIVDAYNMAYDDMPPKLTWTYLILQSEAWALS